MNAYVVWKPGPTASIELDRVKEPEPAAGEVQVLVKGSSVNPADVKVAFGESGSGFIHSTKSPVRLGFDFSGEVSRLGHNVQSWKVGDQVYGHLPYSAKTVQGSYSEKVVIDAENVGSKPEKLDHVQAGAVPTVGCTAFQALVDIGSIQSGMRVMINGASGGVGSFASQLAKHLGAEVWGTASAENQDFLKELGVDHPIDYRRDSFLDQKQKYDIFFDVVSNLSYSKCKHILQQGGVYITLLPDLAFLTGLLTSLFSSKKCKMCVVKSKKKTLERLTQLIDEDAIRVPVSSRFKVEQISEALNYLKKNSVWGKIAVKI